MSPIMRYVHTNVATQRNSAGYEVFILFGGQTGKVVGSAIASDPDQALLNAIAIVSALNATFSGPS